MIPIVPTFTQKQAQQLVNFRLRGFTLKDVAEAMQRNKSTIGRYERLYEIYGLEAFARD